MPAARTPSQPELVEFSELIHLVYAGAIDPTAWRTFLKLMTERLNGNAAVLILRVRSEIAAAKVRNLQLSLAQG